MFFFYITGRPQKLTLMPPPFPTRTFSRLAEELNRGARATPTASAIALIVVPSNPRSEKRRNAACSISACEVDSGRPRVGWVGGMKINLLPFGKTLPLRHPVHLT